MWKRELSHLHEGIHDATVESEPCENGQLPVQTHFVRRQEEQHPAHSGNGAKNKRKRLKTYFLQQSCKTMFREKSFFAQDLAKHLFFSKIFSRIRVFASIL